MFFNIMKLSEFEYRRHNKIKFINKFTFYKNDTVGTTEINACGYMNYVSGSAQEAN